MYKIGFAGWLLVFTQPASSLRAETIAQITLNFLSLPAPHNPPHLPPSIFLQFHRMSSILAASHKPTGRDSNWNLSICESNLSRVYIFHSAAGCIGLCLASSARAHAAACVRLHEKGAHGRYRRYVQEEVHACLCANGYELCHCSVCLRYIWCILTDSLRWVFAAWDLMLHIKGPILC